MGKGKGAVDYWVIKVKAGQTLFELSSMGYKKSKNDPIKPLQKNYQSLAPLYSTYSKNLILNIEHRGFEPLYDGFKAHCLATWRMLTFNVFFVKI